MVSPLCTTGIEVGPSKAGGADLTGAVAEDMVARLTRAGWDAATRAPALDVTVDAAKGLVVVTGHDQLGPDVVGELAEVARRFPSCPAVVIDLEDVDSVDNAAVS